LQPVQFLYRRDSINELATRQTAWNEGGNRTPNGAEYDHHRSGRPHARQFDKKNRVGRHCRLTQQAPRQRGVAWRGRLRHCPHYLERNGRSTARCTTLADFDKEAQAFGLATPLGINSTTGVAGLTLGGGFGWTTRKFGLTIDNLVSADVVTADAKLIRASETEQQDLFWALRGGGGNFGIVTSFEFKLHRLGPEVLSGLIVHPL